MTKLKTKKTPIKTPPFPKVLPEIRSLIETSRRHVATTANLVLVYLYWNIGRVITQDIQNNEKRAGYGRQLLERLAEALVKEYGQGFSLRNLRDMRRFYDSFTIRQALPAEFGNVGKSQALPDELSSTKTPDKPSQKRQAPPAESKGPLPIDFRSHSHLGWTHYRILLGIKDNVKRRFYFEQAALERWSTRELLRKIDGALFERVALSRDTKGLVALEKKKGEPEVTAYEDIFKDPYLLDFLGLKGAYLEKDMEAAIIHNLEQFLSELGSDFCFMARQYPMRIDDVDYFLDLLFYHRGLRCLVAIDLKLGTFSAADKGQMDLYLAWLKENEWREGENEPVGLILCSSKKRQHVEMLIRHGPHRIQVSEYITKLPSKKVLEERLKVYSKLLSQQ
ncbi:MAG: PDDEXK nuclease domain-containing protein [Methanosarcinaceae archaeon]|nr:PDDEXK nuclease domain-containing protein [Methanosarcinaceae archaeon]